MWFLIGFAIFALFLVFISKTFVLLPSWRTYILARKLPRVPEIPFIGSLLLLRGTKEENTLDLLKHLHSYNSEMCGLSVLGYIALLVNTPEYLETIMGSMQYIKKGPEYEYYLQSWLRDGLLLSSGKKWQKRRKILTPTFHFKILEDNYGSLNRNSRVLARNMLKHEGSFNIGSLTSLCTLDIISETAMGISLEAQSDNSTDYVERIKRVSKAVMYRAMKCFFKKDWVFYLTTIGRKYKEDVTQLHLFTEQMIKQRRIAYIKEEETTRGKNQRKAFLDCLIDLDMTQKEALTDLDIREEVDTFMFEGHDTTSCALMFIIYMIGLHPDVQDKVYDEQSNIFEGDDRDVTRADLQKMTYLEKVIKETLRLYPPVASFARGLEHDVQLGKYLVPSGVSVQICPYLLHRNPEVFPDPEKFDPDRFEPELAASRHAFAYIPFSAGPRNCIGQKFAMMELKVTLSQVVRVLKIRSITQRNEFKCIPTLILRPSVPLLIEVTQRM